MLNNRGGAKLVSTSDIAEYWEILISDSRILGYIIIVEYWEIREIEPSVPGKSQYSD